MSRYILLDTDVYSYLTRGDSRGDAFREALASARPCLSIARRYVVVGYDFALARTCGELLPARERIGQRMEEFDAWIAATALRYDIPLATNNRGDFDGIRGLRLVPSG